jgi:2,3-bisphosphoglycerate-dependent phosphoglycerate mutase
VGRLILLRHGESEWNKENRFTGWTDVDLSERGIQEAHRAGMLLKEAGFIFTLAFTSVLKRAIRTLWIVQDDMDLMYIPVRCSWRLNERHYGALQGLDKRGTAQEYGDEKVHEWRRSYSVRPPALAQNDPRHPRFDPRYTSLSNAELPATESLADTLTRVLPYWEGVIAPAVTSENTVMISAHGNSLRALIKYLDDIPDNEIVNLNIPTGFPLIYELDDALRPLRKYYLGSREEIERATQDVAGHTLSVPDAG